MPPDQPQPKRRITDNDRRRWNDHSLDLMSNRLDRQATKLGDHDDELEQLRPLLERSEWMMKTLERLEKKVDENFERNFREHATVQKKANEIASNVAPTRWSKVKDFATLVSVLIVPFLLTYLTIVLARGGTT